MLKLTGARRSHFGVLSFAGTGHLNPIMTLARHLVRRGHRVTFFHTSDLEEKILQNGLEFASIGSVEDAGVRLIRPARKAGVAALRYRVHRTVAEMEQVLRGAPEAMRRAGVDALLIDEIAMAGPTVAEIMKRPYFIISTSVPHNFGWSSPNRFTPRLSCVARLQRALLEVSTVRMQGPVRFRLDRFRGSVGLDLVARMKNTHPALAHITQLPRCLDYPRSVLPENFYYCGPFVDDARAPADFPWHRLDGRRLVYASLGSTLKGDAATFRMIAEACSRTQLQLVLSLGGRRDPQMFQDLPGSPVVVSDAPQLEILKKAEVVITHAGPNTVFETLLQGKPMIALPTAFDQPAVAARLERAGAGIVLPIARLSSAKIAGAIHKVLSEPTFRTAAQCLQREMLSVQGLSLAGDIIETALQQDAHRRAISA
ncbi:glycosyltransferase [Acidipila sp. EB88]|uniref:glycosyltransferase n=1 Tax=Acidipila sp. EB88 TaxID=2305226 RepID=UPI0013157CB0|nr:glycosyltransferase [Acidipila sp. EB88]